MKHVYFFSFTHHLFTILCTQLLHITALDIHLTVRRHDIQRLLLQLHGLRTTSMAVVYYYHFWKGGYIFITFDRFESRELAQW